MTPRRRRRRVTRSAWAVAGAYPTAIFILTALRHTPVNSPGVFYRPFFNLQYDNGIYRYRVLGRVLVIGLSDVVNSVTGGPSVTGAYAATFHAEASLFTGFVIVNGVSLVAFALLVYVVTVRTSKWLPPFLVLVTMTALSAYVVTPYDFLSYALIAATLTVALMGRARSWVWCLPLTVAGMMTRESFFVVAAALLAVRLSERGSIRELHIVSAPSDWLWRAAEAVVAGSLATYFLLRLLLSDGTDPNSFLQSTPGMTNVNWASLVALVIVGLGGLAGASLLPPADRRDPQIADRRRRALALLWVFSSPYLIVSAVGGVWSEALRLVLPVAICHYFVCWYFSRAGQSLARSGTSDGRRAETSPGYPLGA